MDEREVRALLSLSRAGVEEDDDRLAEAQRQAENDPELSAWWDEDQAIDQIIGAKLAAVPIPAGLKAKLTAAPGPIPHPQRTWPRVALLAAAIIIALAVFFGSWRGPFQPATSLGDYRDEMVAFIKVEPNLELESAEMARLKNYLAQAEAPSEFTVPANLHGYEPVGCRVLRYRGRDVSLVCFRIGEGKLAHLFLIDAAAMPVSYAASSPSLVPEGQWMTAAWKEGEEIYLFTVQGNSATAKKFLNMP